MAPTHAGIILAAGRGSRLGKLTKQIHKCQVCVRGKPLIEWQIEAFQEAGLGQLAIITGYLADNFTYPVQYFQNARWHETNMVFSLHQADALLSTMPCIVSYSDIIYPSSIVRCLMEADHDIAISYDPNWESLWSARFGNPLDDAETFKQRNGVLLEIGQKPLGLEEIEGQYMGLLKFTPNGWSHFKQHLNDVDELDMTGALQKLVLHGTRIHTVKHDDWWFEIDTPKDIEIAETLVAQHS